MDIYARQCLESYESYQNLLEFGVAREQARNILNPAIYTSWVWTVSLQALLNFISLRKGEGAQSEIQLYAEEIESMLSELVPHTYKAWINHRCY